MAESSEPVQQRDAPLRRIADFTLIREIGRGGMGIVHEAIQDSMEHRPVALKELVLAGVVDPQREIRRFHKEISAMSHLDHPNIVPIITVGNDGTTNFFTMKLIRGANLREVIASTKSQVNAVAPRRSGDTPPLADATVIAELEQSNAPPTTSMTVHRDSTHDSYVSNEFVELMSSRQSRLDVRTVLQQVTRIGIQAAEALYHAHQTGIVHRDVKPANLLLDEENRVWVTDFGLARVAGEDGHTLPGQLVGTLRYLSPEQALSGRVVVDQRTDIFSLGVTLYEFLTLRRAFDGNSQSDIIHNVCFYDPPPLRRVNPAIPEDLETIISKAMSKAPEDRYQTAQKLADDLRRFENDEAIEARRPTVIQQCRRWLRRHRSLARAAAVTVALVSVVSTVSALLVWNALLAVTREKDRVAALLVQSDGLRLVANSTLQLSGNPGLALALAVHGAEKHPCLEASNALLAALGAIHEKLAISLHREGQVNGLVLSPDGKRCVTCAPRAEFGTGNHPAVVTNLESGQEVFLLDDGTVITSAAYSPDGRFLLSTSSPDPRMTRPGAASPPLPAAPVLWDAKNGVRLRSFSGTSLPAADTGAFSPDAEFVVLPGEDNTAKVCRTRDGETRPVLRGHTARVLSAAFSRDGSRIITVGADNTIRIWGAQDGNPLGVFPCEVPTSQEVTAEFIGGSVPAAHEQLLITDAAGTRVISVQSGERLNAGHIRHTSASLSPVGDLVAAWSLFGKSVSVLDTRLQSVVEVHTETPIRRVMFGPDGRQLAVAAASEVGLYATDDGRMIGTLRGHDANVLDMKFTQDGTQIVTTSEDSTVRIWNTASGQDRRTIVRSVPSGVAGRIIASQPAMSADSKLVVAATAAEFHSEICGPDGQRGTNNIRGYNKDRSVRGNRLATVIPHGAAVWDLTAEKQLASTTFGAADVREVHVVPGLDVVIVVMQGGPTWRWNFRTGERTRLLEADEVAFDCIVNGDNRRIALALRDGRCLIVDAITSNVLQSLTHASPVVALDFTRDGTRLLTIDGRNAARVWRSSDVPAGEFQLVRKIQEAGVSFDRALFSGDGQFVVTWDEGDTEEVRCWDSETGTLSRSTADVIANARVSLHDALPVAIISSRREGCQTWDLQTGEQKILTPSATMRAVFLGEKVLAAELGMQDTTGKAPTAPGDPPQTPALSVWDRHTGERISRDPLSGQPRSLDALASGQAAVLSISTFGASIAQLDDQRPMGAIRHLSSPPMFLAFAGATETVVAVCGDGSVTVADATGNPLQRLKAHEHPVVSAAVSPAGRHLATADNSGAVRLWSLPDGGEIRALKGHPTSVHVIRFSIDGQQVMTVSGDGTLRIHNIDDAEAKDYAFEHGVLTAEFSPDRTQVLVIPGQAVRGSGASSDSGASRGFIKIDDIPDAVLIRVASGQQQVIELDGIAHTGCFSPDGRYFSLVPVSGAAVLFEASTGEAVREIGDKEGRIECAAFSPDTQQLALMHSASDAKIALHSVETGAVVLRLQSPDELSRAAGFLGPGVPWIPFSPDGRWIITLRNQVEQWPAGPLREALREVPRKLAPAERREFLLDLPPSVKSP